MSGDSSAGPFARRRRRINETLGPRSATRRRLLFATRAAGESRGGGGARVEFLYAGQARPEIPRGATHVRVDPSVRRIGDDAFEECERLEELELCEGLEEIGNWAFSGCKSLKRVVIPPTIKRVGKGAFDGCEQLEEVDLCEGLKTIGESMFESCECLKRIRVPSTVKIIGWGTFDNCEQLEEVELCEGLEKIGMRAFVNCVSLKRIRIPSTVKVIGWGAFRRCERLEEVETLQGLEEICDRVFEKCTHLKRIGIPSTVGKVGRRAFRNCSRLEEVDLCEGLENIGKHAFECCESLRYITLPSTLKLLGKGAFQCCHKLERLDLCEGLEQLCEHTFDNCRSLHRISIPSTVKKIDNSAFNHCVQLVSVELGNGLEQIGELAFANCFLLRNISVPSTVKNMGRDAFQGCHDIRKLLGAQNESANALKCRLEELPIHQLCYDQSRRPSQVISEQLQNMFGGMSDHVEASVPAELSRAHKKENEKTTPTSSESGSNTNLRCRGAARSDATIGSAMASSACHSRLNIYNAIDHSQDCLGMTPLHILACSVNQNLDLYQLIVANHPNCLVTKDNWGCTPFFYAVWGRVPPEIVKFLIDSQKSVFPDIDLNWDMMVSILCGAHAPLHVVRMLLRVQKASFSEQNINWQKAAQQLTIHCLIGCGSFDVDFPSRWEFMTEVLSDDHAYQGLIESLLEIQQSFFPDQSITNWQALCEEFVKPLKGWWRNNSNFSSSSVFQFLVRCSIPERLNEIGIRNWQKDIKYLVEKSSSVYYFNMSTHLDTLHSRLVFYECEYSQMKDAMILVELAIWKSKIDDSTGIERHKLGPSKGLICPKVDMKTQCRINCGAEIIIPNVLPYLIANAEKGNFIGADGDMGANSSSDEDIFESSSDEEGNISSTSSESDGEA